MKRSIIVAAVILSFCLLKIPSSFADTDGIYQLSEVTDTTTWDGTDADRTATPTRDYDYAYGDDASLAYSLPIPFTFYGQDYSNRQINVDTNGNIWFGAVGSGPVIRAWNDDLSSYYYGGVFIQHKSDAPLGERVVIEWQTETYTDEGQYVPNNFEVVLFPHGRVRIDYRSITTGAGNDGGSGIYKGDGVYNDITTNFAPVPTLTASGQRSFLYTLQIKNLQVNFTGTGGGTITISPSGKTCNTNCYDAFPALTSVTLHPVPGESSLFNEWTGGPCTGTGCCTLLMTADTTATASFDNYIGRQARIDNGSTTTYFSTIQEAYDAAASGAIIKLLAIVYTENVICAGGKSVVFQGGYNGDYTAVTGTSKLKGKLTINSGSGVNVKNFTMIPPTP